MSPSERAHRSAVMVRPLLHPNHVHVIPSNKAPSLKQGTLLPALLTDGSKLINDSFYGVPRDRRENEIGVILPGAAANGIDVRSLKAS